MMSRSTVTRADLLAALQFQYDWGADEVIEDIPWDTLASPPRRLGRQEKSAAPLSAPSGRASVPPAPAARVEGGVCSEILQAPDLPTLIALSDTIEGVGLARTATHRLAPVLVENAPFMVISETPDADEDRSGLLLQGRAGSLFDRMLTAIGFDRNALSLAPAIPWRPPGGRSVTESEMRACLPVLQRSIALCRPPLLVTLGATPARMLLGEEAVLSRVRGKWAQVTIPGLATPVAVLPLNHPLQLSASATIRRNLWHDLLILVSKLDGDKLD